MEVRMTTKIQGSRNGEYWPEINGVIDLPDGEAMDLINAGLADRIAMENHEPEPVNEPETQTGKKADRTAKNTIPTTQRR